jgi:hypothetical protein
MTKKNSLDALRTPAFPVETFGTGEVAQILDVPMWRLQKFLQGQRYDLSPTGQIGKGRGSRRLFTRMDIYRIATAARLTQDGFTPTFVAEAVQQIDDEDFIDHMGYAVDSVLAFERGQGRSVPRVYLAKQLPKMGGPDSPYYFLDLSKIMSEADGRIKTLKQ